MDDDLIFCPSCNEPTEHITLKSEHQLLVRCSECGTVHTVQLERPRLTGIKVIVSRDESARVYNVKMPAKEELHVGDEILVDDETEEVVSAEITSLETDRRVEKAEAGSVKTVWARAIDDVIVKVSVFKHGKTRSVKQKAPGDETFHVGQTGVAEGIRYRVEKIKLRKGGFVDMAKAKDITRIWGSRL